MLGKPCDSKSLEAADAVRRRRTVLVGLLRGIVLLAALAGWCRLASACNTPVYRYAMYNWKTSPYIVFYFHEGEVAEADRAVHEEITRLTENLPPQANVHLEPIDVTDEKMMEVVPDFVVDAWKSHEGGKLPAHVIFAPSRAHVYSGRLDGESVKRLVDSPARQRLGALLEEGNAAVMILLTCADEEQNKKAEESLAELLELADAGKIPVAPELPPLGLSEGPDEEGGSAEGATPSRLSIAVLRVDRNDLAEEFFVRMLMAIEGDLDEYGDQPMIFAGYGRGRAMEPYIGKGIQAENLVEVVAFLAGACSCLVKEQNPGVDILVKWNWDETADKMAENDPTLDYDPYGQQGQSGSQTASQATADVDESQSVAAATAGPSAEIAAPVEVALAPGSASPTDGGSLQSGAEREAAELVVSSEEAGHDGPAVTASFARRRMVAYTIAFAVLGAGVLLAGLALMMRRS